MVLQHPIIYTIFLQQSNHKSKNTPGLNNKRDHINHKDGFGFAYLSPSSHKWKIYKNPLLYTDDTKLDKIINEKISRSNIILGHIRKNEDKSGTNYENTHPFHYKNKIFLHNGNIL